MKKSPRIYEIMLVVFTVWFSIFAQIDLTSIRSQSVQSFKRVPTKIDTLHIETEVSHGIAYTSITMVIEPGPYTDYKQLVSLCNDTSADICEVLWEEDKEIVDSIEITLGFTLPVDFCVNEMYLWVDGKKQRAYIQDKALAKTQYEQIVNRRTDPALLEFRGNGRYNLSIFPTESFKARKVAIAFSHTFDDDSSGFITCAIPVSYRKNTYTNWYLLWAPCPIGIMSAVFTASDEKTYSCTVPGLGTGTFSFATPLTLDTPDIDTLVPGLIVANHSVSGCKEYLWHSKDTRDETETLGFTALLSSSTVALDPEPENRIIILDIRDSTWNNGMGEIELWHRAQKYAVLCMKHYVSSNQKFNIILPAKNVTKIFDSPVPPYPHNLSRAFNVLKRSHPDKETATLDAVKEGIRQADNGIIICISDMYYYDQWDSISNVTSIDTTIDALKSLLDTSSLYFFSLTDDYRLMHIARETGGFNLAYLRWRSSYWKITESNSELLVDMPPLFGIYNPGGISITSVEAPKGLNNVVYTLDRDNYYPIIGMTDTALTSSFISTDTDTKPVQTIFRLAAKKNRTLASTGDRFKVKGKIAGLQFTWHVPVTIPDYSPDIAADDIQWAFRKTEYLAQENWENNSDSIKALGLAYHIVSRQTSLLALEPGIDLWEDTVWVKNNNDQNNITNSIISDSMSLISITSCVDSFSLNALFCSISAAQENIVSTPAPGIIARFTAAGLQILFPRSVQYKTIRLTLYTVKGQKVLSRTVSRHEIRNQLFYWHRNDLRKHLGGSCYIMHIQAGTTASRLKIPFIK